MQTENINMAQHCGVKMVITNTTLHVKFVWWYLINVSISDPLGSYRAPCHQSVPRNQTSNVSSSDPLGSYKVPCHQSVLRNQTSKVSSSDPLGSYKAPCQQSVPRIQTSYFTVWQSTHL